MHTDYRLVTLEQLLAQRSGFSENTHLRAGLLPSLVDKGELGTDVREQRRKYVELILQEKPAHPPGTKFAYSNRNYITAGAILERITDTAWEDLIRKRLFEPLDMTTAGFGAMGTAGKVDQPWQHQSFFGWRTPIEPGPKADNPPLLGPAGTVHSSAGDWAKYILEHLRGESGQSKLLKAEAFQRLHTPRKGEDYAGGWLIAERKWGGGKVIWHNGSNTMNFCAAWLAPLRDFACLALTNQGGLTADGGCDQACERLIMRFLPSN
jgi:CubicO group peptidase (beta-lactamase class C family)